MNEQERATEGVWPPAPRRDEPPPLFLRVESMEITRNGNRLIVLNKSIYRLFLVEICLLSTCFVSPWIIYWINPFDHATLSGWLPHVISEYRRSYNQILYLFMLSMIAGVWYLLTLVGNLGGVTLDGRGGTVKAAGRKRPMSSIKAVVIQQTPNALLGPQYLVSLLWNRDYPPTLWQKRLANMRMKTCTLGALRQQANAGRVAAVVAEFAGVPVRHQSRRKNSV